MIPKGLVDTNINISEETNVSRTYKVSETKIQGFTDELKALEQAIFKELSTERYEYPIYSFSYGIDLQSLVGKDSTYVKIEIKRRIQECLMKDSRIKSVENFQLDVKGDEMLCTFDVISTYGEMTITREVNV